MEFKPNFAGRGEMEFLLRRNEEGWHAEVSLNLTIWKYSRDITGSIRKFILPIQNNLCATEIILYAYYPY
jgi:hypothetical protein